MRRAKVVAVASVAWAIDRLAAALARRGRARGIFFTAARHYTPVVVSEIGNATYYVHTRDRDIGSRLFWAGERTEEIDDMDSIRELLAVHNPAALEKPTIIDIGANIGTSTIQPLIAGHYTTAVAIEPDAGNYDLLVQNVRVNRLDGRVRTHHLALSDRIGEAELELATPDNLGDYRLRPMRAQSSAMSVKTTTFDALVESGDIELESVGLVWMDTQGHEGHILSGAASLVSAGVPVFAEFWPHGLREAGGYDEFLVCASAGWSHFAAIGGWPAPTSVTFAKIATLADFGRSLVGEAHTNVLLLRPAD